MGGNQPGLYAVLNDLEHDEKPPDDQLSPNSARRKLPSVSVISNRMTGGGDCLANTSQKVLAYRSACLLQTSFNRYKDIPRDLEAIVDEFKQQGENRRSNARWDIYRVA